MIVSLFRAVLFHGLFAAAAGIGATANAQTLALVGGKVYASPDAAPLADAVVVATNGVITAIGSRSEVQIPPSPRDRLHRQDHRRRFLEQPRPFHEAVWRNAAARRRLRSRRTCRRC